MDRVLLERCVSIQEIAKEIWRQSFNICTINDEYGTYDQDKKVLWGFYLKSKKSIKNTPFDIYLNIVANSYCKIINEWNDRYYDGVLFGYEVMLKWLEGQYRFKYIPTTCEEFIDIIFDEQKAIETTKYLCGVSNRLIKNALYCSYEKNGISKTKYYTHRINKDGVDEKTFVDLLMIELDKPYEYTEGQEASSHRILDEYLLKNDKIDSVESELFDINESEDSIYKYLYNNFLTENNKKRVDNSELDTNSNFYVRKKICKKIDNFDSLIFDKNGVLKFGGNFLDFGKKFMIVSLEEKFKMIKEGIDKNNSIASLLTDIIYGLDYEITKEFVHMLKSDNEVEIKEYHTCDNFKVIIDNILNVYFEKQMKLKEIYLYNENTRRNKIIETEKYIRSLERKKDKTLGVMEINKIFKYAVELFDFKVTGKKKELTIDYKLNVLKKLGFVFEAVVDTKRYSCSCICETI